jgi:DNA-binding CsgD family transcriptional regulator
MSVERPVADRLSSLSSQEKSCLRLVEANLSSKEIARELGISHNSVDTHLRRAKQKLGISDRHAAARLLVAWEGGSPLPSLGQSHRPTAESASLATTFGRAFQLPPIETLGPWQRLSLMAGGAIVMALVFALILAVMRAI